MPRVKKKVCSRCRFPKPIDDFGLNRSRKDGRNRACKGCHRTYTAKHYADNKEYYKAKARKRDAAVGLVLKAIIRDAKSKPCIDCNEPYPTYVMDFDHVRGVKLFEIGHAVSKGVSVPTLLAEIAKCEVVCANCHRQRTHDRKKKAV
jgi:hypothetical protein